MLSCSSTTFTFPVPDPLTSPDSMKRVEEYYADQVRGAPTVFIGGKLGPGGGGPKEAAEGKYTAFRKQIEEGLEKAARRETRPHAR